MSNLPVHSCYGDYTVNKIQRIVECTQPSVAIPGNQKLHRKVDICTNKKQGYVYDRTDHEQYRRLKNELVIRLASRAVLGSTSYRRTVDNVRTTQ